MRLILELVLCCHMNTEMLYLCNAEAVIA
jgi:hypothetical protein